MAGCREARRAALQASLAEKQALEQAGHNYKANPVPAHIHIPSVTPLPEPSFTVRPMACLSALLPSQLFGLCMGHTVHAKIVQVSQPSQSLCLH